MIRPYLSDIINNQKTPEVLQVQSGKKVIDYEQLWENGKFN